jgi:hypothetical protein
MEKKLPTWHAGVNRKLVQRREGLTEVSEYCQYDYVKNNKK